MIAGQTGGGFWSTLATGLFAATAVNSGGVDGLFYGDPMQFAIQAKAAGIVAAYTFAATIVILKIVGLVLPLSASEDEEKIGLDIGEHREAGYTLID